MNVIVQGTKKFSDYSIFVRAMGVAMSDLRDDSDSEFVIYSAGPATVNSFTAEFANKIESSMRQRGIRVKFHRVPPRYIEGNLEMFDYFAFLTTPNEKISPLFYAAQATDMDAAVFRY